jgi:hypothetical protein
MNTASSARSRGVPLTRRRSDNLTYRIVMLMYRLDASGQAQPCGRDALAITVGATPPAT